MDRVAIQKGRPQYEPCRIEMYAELIDPFGNLSSVIEAEG